jgi:hypothetical protein
MAKTKQAKPGKAKRPDRTFNFKKASKKKAAKVPASKAVKPAKKLAFPTLRALANFNRFELYQPLEEFQDFFQKDTPHGHECWLRLNSDGGVLFVAGCRTFNVGQALNHWDPKTYHRIGQFNDKAQNAVHMRNAKGTLKLLLKGMNQAAEYVRKWNAKAQRAERKAAKISPTTALNLARPAA